MRITLVSENGKHTVSVNGEAREFPTLLGALAYIYNVTERNKTEEKAAGV